MSHIPVKGGIALLWVLVLVVAFFVKKPELRPVIVGGLCFLAIGATLIALAARWRRWPPWVGPTVLGVVLTFAAGYLWLLGFVPVLMLAILVGALVAGSAPAFLRSQWLAPLAAERPCSVCRKTLF